MAKYKVLIVEDDQMIQDGYAMALEAGNFTVLRANNGEEGLEISLKEKPDIILLDISMPIMDGLTMLEELRKDEGYGKDAKVILLTNLSANTEDIIKKVAQTAPLFYIVKTSLTFREVVNKIKEILK